MRVVHTRELAFRGLSGRRAADPLIGQEAGGVSVRIVRVDVGERRPHRHPHSVEVIYVLGGAGHHRQGDEEKPVQAGDVVLVGEGVSHWTRADEGAPLTLLCFFPHPDLTQNLIEETT